MWLVLAITAALMSAVGVPLWLEKVPPNWFYGFRTPRTVSDPRVWYPANRVLGRDLTVASVVAAAIALIAGAASWLGLEVGLWPLLPYMAPLFFAALHGFWSASVTVARLDGYLAEDEPERAKGAEKHRARSPGKQAQREQG